MDKDSQSRSEPEDAAPGDPSVHENEVLRGLEYPSDTEFPYPFHDTGVRVTATVINPNPFYEEDKSDEPYDLTGNLYIRPSPFGGFQCAINNEFVKPETVRRTKGDREGVKEEDKGD